MNNANSNNVMKESEQFITETINKAMAIAHERQEVILIQTINKTVNGKIDSFREDQKVVNEKQNEDLKQIKDSVQKVIDVYDGSSKFFRVTKTAAAWITVVVSACVAVWAFIKFVVQSAIK